MAVTLATSRLGMTLIYHIAEAADWERARRDGRYTTSTRGRTLAEEGFIHASTAAQVDQVADAFYRDAPDLVLLVIDTERVGSPSPVRARARPGPAVSPHLRSPERRRGGGNAPFQARPATPTTRSSNSAQWASIWIPSARRRKSSWSSSRFSATVSCDAMWVIPDSGSTVCGSPGRQQRARQPQRVRHHHVVVRQPVDEHEGPVIGRPFGILISEERSYGSGILVGVAQVALGVVGVVEAPVGDRGARRSRRRTRPGGAARPARPGSRRTTSRGSRPAPVSRSGYRAAASRSASTWSSSDRPGQVAGHRALPLRAAAGRAPAVRDDHREPVLGEPLRGQVGGAGLQHPLRVRAAVRVEQHRQLPAPAGLVPRREQHRRADLPRPGAEQHRPGRGQRRAFGVRGELGHHAPVRGAPGSPRGRRRARGWRSPWSRRRGRRSRCVPPSLTRLSPPGP